MLEIKLLLAVPVYHTIPTRTFGDNDIITDFVMFATLLDVRTIMKAARNPLGPHVPVNANH